MNKVCIDIQPKSAYRMIVSKLNKLKTTHALEDCGEYSFGGPTGWFKIIITTTKAEQEVDNWLYNLSLPINFDYGTCVVEENSHE